MTRKAAKKPARTLKQAEARIKALETLCADLYQVVGVAGAPVRGARCGVRGGDEQTDSSRQAAADHAARLR